MDYGFLWQQTNIPKWAPIYGGVRGRTMSSHYPAHAWKMLQEAGVKLIIDLRDKDTTARLKGLCELHGMNYYHYPIHTNAEVIAQMAEHFEQFCRLIDAGDFYISCAMGLHRTDIALCAYWVFYGANKGLRPPRIRGYSAVDGHRIDKINRVLNALYAAFTERNGIEPMPKQTFKHRKNIIFTQSQL